MNSLPKMYHVREDVKTNDQRAKLLYAWLQLGEEHMPEITIPNKNYKGNTDRPGFVFGGNATAQIFSWRDIPTFEDFKKALNQNGEVATCIAAVDATDRERLGLFDLQGQMALTVYGEMTPRHEMVFDKLDEAYDRI